MWYGQCLQNESKSHVIGLSHCFFSSSWNCCLAKTPDRFHNLGTIYRAPVVFSFSAQLHRLKPRPGVCIHAYSYPQGEDRNFWAWFATMALLIRSDWWNNMKHVFTIYPYVAKFGLPCFFLSKVSLFCKTEKQPCIRYQIFWSTHVDLKGFDIHMFACKLRHKSLTI